MGKGGKKSRPTLMAWKWSVICIKVVTRLSLFLKKWRLTVLVHRYSHMKCLAPIGKQSKGNLRGYTNEVWKRKERGNVGENKISLSIHFWHDFFKAAGNQDEVWACAAQRVYTAFRFLSDVRAAPAAINCLWLAHLAKWKMRAPNPQSLTSLAFSLFFKPTLIQR